MEWPGILRGNFPRTRMLTHLFRFRPPAPSRFRSSIDRTIREGSRIRADAPAWSRAKCGTVRSQGRRGALARRVSDRSQEADTTSAGIARGPTEGRISSVPQGSSTGQASGLGKPIDVRQHATANMQSKLGGTAAGGLRTSVKTDLSDRPPTIHPLPCYSIRSRTSRL
jgi:hypothetical protein